METRHREVLKRHRVVLIDDLISVDSICDQLIQDKVIERSVNERIKAETTPLEKARKLLDTLPSCGPKAFNSFLTALHSCCEHLARKLEESETEVLQEEGKVCNA